MQLPAHSAPATRFSYRPFSISDLRCRMKPGAVRFTVEDDLLLPLPLR